MVPIVSIVGVSGSGKTTLLEKVTGELVKRGYSVGVIKHDAHDFEIDREGKDSWRHKKAGASAVIVSSPRKFALVKDVKKEWPPERLAKLLSEDVDIVVTEGYKKGPFPKIEVVRKEASSKTVSKENLIAVASDLKIKGRFKRFGLNDFKGIADLIEERFLKTRVNPEVSLTVNGKPVALKPFIEGLLKEGVTGMIKSLKGCSGAQSIELVIKR